METSGSSPSYLLYACKDRREFRNLVKSCKLPVPFNPTGRYWKEHISRGYVIIFVVDSLLYAGTLHSLNGVASIVNWLGDGGEKYLELKWDVRGEVPLHELKMYRIVKGKAPREVLNDLIFPSNAPRFRCVNTDRKLGALLRKIAAKKVAFSNEQVRVENLREKLRWVEKETVEGDGTIGKGVTVRPSKLQLHTTKGAGDHGVKVLLSVLNEGTVDQNLHKWQFVPPCDQFTLHSYRVEQHQGVASPSKVLQAGEIEEISVVLHSRCTVDFEFSYSANCYGTYEFMLMFYANNVIKGIPVTVNVSKDNLDISSLAPIAPYEPPTVNLQELWVPHKGRVLSAPERHMQNFTVVPLKFYHPPASYWNQDIDPLRNGTMSPSNYAAWFRSLLWLEEVQMNVDIDQFTLIGVTLSRAKDGLFYIEVPGLAERRPSVLVGDRLCVRSTHTKSQEHHGFVKRVEQLKVALEMHKSFTPGTVDWDIRFTVPRLPLRMMHRALDNVQPCRHLLFPKHHDARPSNRKPIALKFHNEKLHEEQRKCITNIANNTQGSIPYIIFGPPGTGKTMTLVESVYQSLKRNTRILVATPSNGASDLILQRLLEYPDHRLEGNALRLNAFYRRPEEIPAELHRYCCTDPATTLFSIPVLNTLKKYQLIVSTCASVGKLISSGMDNGWFDAIYIDEAAQSIEPEILVALSLANNRTEVILAGDFQQLGAVVHSSVAMNHKLQISYMERLVRIPNLYHNTAQPNTEHNEETEEAVEYIEGALPAAIEWDTNRAIQFQANYRSNPALIKLASLLFYQGKLFAAKPYCFEKMTWTGYLRHEFPIMFYGIEGKDMREGGSPSFFNPAEVAAVLEVIETIQKHKEYNYTSGDIGVITPYHKHAQKLRRTLTQKGYEDIHVGTVESFQGQERKIIIVSTVRSSSAFLDFDYKHNIGFLKNPKRFNVSITRAKSLLALVGNPFLLSVDKHWKALLKYCIKNDAYVGTNISQLKPHLFPNKDSASMPATKSFGKLEKVEELLGEVPLPDGEAEEELGESVSSPATPTSPTKSTSTYLEPPAAALATRYLAESGENSTSSMETVSTQDVISLSDSINTADVISLANSTNSGRSSPNVGRTSPVSPTVFEGSFRDPM